MLRPGKSTSLRLALCSALIAYLVGDFFVFKGPLSRIVENHNAPNPDLAARVSGHPISNSQLERTLNERLWLEGKTTADLTPADLKTARQAALDELIDHTLLRLQVRAIAPQLPVSEAEINERLSLLVGRFENKGELETAMKSQGIAAEQNLRDRLAARIRQEKLIALRIGPSIKVSDDEARQWFDENHSTTDLPERIEVRHIFIPTLDHPPEEAKQKLDAALVELTEKKKEFPSLAKELSEDPATNDKGGSLGWMTRDRLPADFAAPVFSLETNKPTLVRTKLGWHLVEVTARKPAEPLAFEQAKPEIIAALVAIKRRQAVADFRKDLRRSDAAKIEIFQDVAAVSNRQAQSN